MKDINNKINNLKEKIEGIKEEQYKELFDSVSDILSDLSSKIEEISLKQDYLERILSILTIFNWYSRWTFWRGFIWWFKFCEDEYVRD